MPAGGRVTLVDIGAIALAIALGVGAWRFHPGQDARGARDKPTTTTEDTEEPAPDGSTTTAPGTPADPTATTAPADPTATTTPAGGTPTPAGEGSGDPGTSVPDGEAPATTAPASPGSTSQTTDLS